ncbi:MAG: type II toxin-antitoxin system HipA family toxin, partial [Gemmatimonadaceae bacterium]
MNERLEVRIHDEGTPRVVGELVDVGSGPHFQYAPSFLQEGVELSPLQLARDTRVFPPGPIGLYRLQGLFFDSLPDGWGLRLLHQAMHDAGLDAARTSAVTWLRALGTHGMGALTFHPPMHELRDQAGEIPDLATLAAEAQAVEAHDIAHVLPALTRAGGSSGGARPKIVAGWHESGAIVDAFAPLPPGYRPALIKFAARTEPADAPLVEAAYLSMAALAGLDVPGHQVHALPKHRWALIVDRFDRVGDARRHVHTLAGLLGADIRHDFVDYET